MSNTELIARLRSFETDHKPDGWPAIQMRDVSALLDAIEALEAEVERLTSEAMYCSEYADLEDLMFERIERAARTSFRKHKSSIRGQQITRADSYESHLVWAAQQEMKAQLAAAQAEVERLKAFAGGYANENLRLQAQLAAAQAQEPVGFVESAVRGAGGFHACFSSGVFVPAGTQLYTAPIPQQVAEPAECCEHCDDGDGLCVFPMYGPAPHTHDTSSGWIGSTRTLPKEQWGNNFREDPDCKGHGVYMRCESCGRGEQQATAPSVPEGWKLVPIEATPEMIESGAAHQYGSSSSYQNNLDAENTWDSMLAAAPQPKE